ncbi:MAG: hypothetical protein LUF29_03225 [Oscillospiraceae bacterium]|nr:hypothetical protein [Oscillospiraceae bacterium]
MTYEEYEAAIKKYLVLCDWRYPEDVAKETVEINKEYIRKSFGNKETVGDIAMDIGFVG